MKTEWTPKNLSIAGGVIVSALLILPNLGNAWKIVRWITDAFPTAYAAKEQVDQVDSKFQQYLQAQKEAAIAQHAAADAINAYVGQQKQMQQHASNQRYQPTQERESSEGRREWSEEEQAYFCCPSLDRQRCSDQDLWNRCE